MDKSSIESDLNRAEDGSLPPSRRRPWTAPQVFVSLDARSSEIKHVTGGIPDTHSLTASYS
jgi:hypothetical protein